MPFTTPRTWVVGEMVNAALLNTYIRDNLQFLHDEMACRVTRTGAAQSIPNAAFTTIDLDTTDFDTSPGSAMVDLVNNRINFLVSGKYLIGAILQYASNSTGVRSMRVTYRDTVANSIIAFLRTSVEPTGLATTYGEGMFDCKAGDYIYLEAYQDSGAALTALTLIGLCPLLYCVRKGI
jgi:hypothetical protein